MTIDEVISSIERDIKANELIMNNLKSELHYFQDADKTLDNALDIRTLEHVINAYQNCLRRIKQVKNPVDIQAEYDSYSGEQEQMEYEIAQFESEAAWR